MNWKKIRFLREPPAITGREYVALVWAGFWLLVLTTGEPDLLGAVVGLVGRLGGVS